MNTHLMPADALYILHTGEKIFADGFNVEYPLTFTDNDNFIFGDYKYIYHKSINGWHAQVIDKNKSTYEQPLSQIADIPVNSFYETFKDCINLTVSPTIPDTVNDMRSTFNGCTALQTAHIGNNVIDISNCFANCQCLTTISNVPETIKNAQNAFLNCVSLVQKPTF